MQKGIFVSWKRNGSALAAGLFCIVLAAIALMASSFAAPEPVQASQDLASGTHMGVASCGGTTCHGRQEADGEVVRQDELSYG